MKKQIILALLLLASISMAGVVNVYINGCGDYTASMGGTNQVRFQLNQSITATTTATESVCVNISVTGGTGGDAYFNSNGHTITYSNGTATTAILITHTTDAGDESGVKIIFNGSLVLSNFVKGLEYATANTAGSYEINPTIYCTNCTYAFYGQLDAEAPITTVVYPCNTTYANWVNISGSGKTHSFTIDTNATCAVKPNIILSNTQPNDGPIFMASNMLFSGNILFGNFSYNASSGSTTYHADLSGEQISKTSTSANWYFSNPIVYSVGGTGPNLFPSSNLTAISSQFSAYYCGSGACNPLVFQNYMLPSTGFFLDQPAQVTPTKIQGINYSRIEFYWKQGLDNFLVGSSINSTDSVFNLQPYGAYLVNITDQTGTTAYDVTISCSFSQFNYCILNFVNGAPYTYSNAQKLPYLLLCHDQNGIYQMQANLTDPTAFHQVDILLSNGSVVSFVQNNSANYGLNVNETGVSAINYSINGNQMCRWSPIGSFFGFSPFQFPDTQTKTLVALPIFISVVALSIPFPPAFAFALATNDFFQFISIADMALLGLFIGILGPITGWFGERNLKTLIIFFVVGATYIIIVYAYTGQPFSYTSGLQTSIDSIMTSIQSMNLVNAIFEVPIFFINLLTTLLALPAVLVAMLLSIITGVSAPFGAAFASFGTALTVALYGYIALKAYEVVSNKYRGV